MVWLLDESEPLKMRALITICCLIATFYLALQYHDLSDSKDAAESKLRELAKENENIKSDLEAANAQISQLNGKAPLQNPKTNWIDEKNRNWQSSLNR
jgi:peptidoglycan hydrolase CwlO-like protein